MSMKTLISSFLKIFFTESYGEPQEMAPIGTFPKQFNQGSPRRYVMRWKVNDMIVDRYREISNMQHMEANIDIYHPEYMLSFHVPYWGSWLSAIKMSYNFETKKYGPNPLPKIEKIEFCGDLEQFEEDLVLLKFELME